MSTPTLNKSFVAAQKAFGPALKTATNPHFKSRYADLASVVDAVLEHLNNNGIALTQDIHECENGVKIQTMFLHESGEERGFGVLHIPATKNDAAGYGSALTYARRYSLMAACGVAPEDDDGQAAAKSAERAHSIVINNHKRALMEAKADGIDALKAAWDALDAATKAELATFKDELKGTAKAKVPIFTEKTSTPASVAKATDSGESPPADRSSAPAAVSRSRQTKPKQEDNLVLDATPPSYADTISLRMRELKTDWQEVAGFAERGGLFLDPKIALADQPADVLQDVLNAWTAIAGEIMNSQEGQP